MLDSLFRSHEELCTVLRLFGRQMLQLHRDDPSLGRIREVLKRADNIRRQLRVEEESSKHIDELLTGGATSPSEHSGGPVINDAPLPKRIQKRNRLTRPYSLRVLRFPPLSD
jgi:hypothetical protein